MEGKRTREEIGPANRELSPIWAQAKSSSVPAESVQDRSWVVASQGGDNLAFNRLVLKWERTIYNVASRMLPDQQEAEEATQEIFLLAYRNIRRFRQDAKFSTWLYRIAINHCITRNRSRPQGIQISLDDQSQHVLPEPQLHAAGSQEIDLLEAENRSRVRSALLFLPSEQRAVIELKFYQELTFEEIAEILKVPMSTIKSRLYAGLELLKVRLGKKA